MARRYSSREVVAQAVGADIDEVTFYMNLSTFQYEGRVFFVGRKPPVREGWRLFSHQPTWLPIPAHRLVWEATDE